MGGYPGTNNEFASQAEGREFESRFPLQSYIRGADAAHPAPLEIPLLRSFIFGGSASPYPQNPLARITAAKPPIGR